ncbi:Acyl-CoA-binding domain-containing protein 3 [Striga hermonthica]|uniref:Acyl-CoA-binding domain-containing protein 3 n=1 Tax=Striga hermonthica TaxID=68872 RepID=A0A9N7NYE0_STRHE|nr:Acyl-CoA-binding domain-containing protein 3 [Striga hermonthica]
MEFLQDLPTFTAFLAIILTFILAKIVSFAVSCSDIDEDEVSCSDNEGPVAKDSTLAKGSRVRTAKGKTKVKFLDDVFVRRLDRYEGFENLQLLDINVERFGENDVNQELSEKVINEKVELQIEDELAGDNGDGAFSENHKSSGISVQEGEQEGKGLVGCDENEEKAIVESVDGDVDDDWEGIERSELEKVFAEAVNYLEYGGKGKDKDCEDSKLAKLGSDVQMELYGLHKVAVEGPCHEPQPMAFKVAARAKWNAWQKLGSMSRDMAMEKYIKLLSDNIPGWVHDYSMDFSKLEAIEKTPDPEPERKSESSLHKDDNKV